MDGKKWMKAFARFQALKRNMPGSVDVQRVNEYHSILHELQDASGEDLSSFRIPESELNPVPTRVPFASRRNPHPRTQYSSERYVDDDFFARQVDGVSNIVQRIAASLNPQDLSQRPDYWSMSDDELERRAERYHIPPAAMSPDGRWYIDRDRIIDQLVKRDAALSAGQPPPPPNQTINVGTMTGSTIQQGTRNSTAIVNYNASDIRVLIAKIQGSLGRLELSAAANSQLTADLNTVSAQLDSPHPKPSIITECLHSARTILENIAGNVIATGLAFEIGKLLS